MDFAKDTYQNTSDKREDSARTKIEYASSADVLKAAKEAFPTIKESLDYLKNR